MPKVKKNYDSRGRKEFARQKRSEYAARYAERAVGQSLIDFLNEHNIAKPTWYFWMKHADFAAEIEHIDEQRRRICIEPVAMHLRLLTNVQVQRALEGDTRAYEVLMKVAGVLGKSAEVNLANFVTVNTQAQPQNLEEALERDAETRKLLDSFVEVIEREKAEDNEGDQ